jgi:NhaP-type Na+/H+ or K+/H+ antiporter
LITLLALRARKFRLPYTVILVFAGLLLPFFPLLRIPEISPDLFLALLLPPFIFETAYKLDFNSMIKEADAVLSLAFVGTLLSALLIGGAAYFLLRFNLIEAFLLGIIVSPTDPVAAVSTFRSMGVSKSFSIIVEGEALFNDGVAIVVFLKLLAAVETGSLRSSH